MEIAIICLIFLSIVIFIFFKLQNNKLQDLNLVLQQKNQEQVNKIDINEKKINLLSNYAGRFEQSEIIIKELKEENKNLLTQIDNLKNNLANLDTQKQLLLQKSDNLEEEKANWHQEKEKLLFQLSEELIRKNKEDQEKFSQNQKEEIKKVTENLFQNFENITNKVSSLGDDVQKSMSDINLTKNALLNPGGAGLTSEITLENILKSSGLQEKKSDKLSGDYILQSHFLDSNNNSKRPDAVIFLPDNHILIIDSKSSSHFLELQKAKDENNQSEIKDIRIKLKDRMNQHLSDLKKRSYAKSKLDDLDLNNMFEDGIKPIISTAMFLQSEKMLDIIRDISPNFEQKALDEKIWIIGPIGLINLLNQSKFIINHKKQEKNIDNLRVEVKKMIESVGIILTKSQDVGKNLYRSMKSFNEFATSFNGNFLKKISNMNELGIEFDKKHFTKLIEKYDITQNQNIIELPDN
ncbi:DNA recombination protein RmuC, partial [Rickettsiales bacterium]|nr:DNA recombination protein RmuC [Rickettsiales bacterium]